MNGELANSAVAIGWSASPTRNLRTMSASEAKSRFTWTVQVRNIMSRPRDPVFAIAARMIPYRAFGIRGISSRRQLGTKPGPMKPMPMPSATAFTWPRWTYTSTMVWWMFSSGAPDNSIWPPGSVVIAWAPWVSPTILPSSSTGSQSNCFARLSNKTRMPQGPS